MASWINEDGLAINFGTDEAVKRNIGSYCQYGPVHWVEILMDFSELPLVADNSVILNDFFVLPDGAFIESVEIRVPETAFNSAADGELFNLGWIDTDRSSNVDVDAFIVAATQTELNTGGTNVAGWVGVGVGAVLATAKLLTWEVNVEQPTAGSTVIRIKWSFPPKNAASDSLVWSKA
jgi:hypothetical protein